MTSRLTDTYFYRIFLAQKCARLTRNVESHAKVLGGLLRNNFRYCQPIALKRRRRDLMIAQSLQPNINNDLANRQLVSILIAG